MSSGVTAIVPMRHASERIEGKNFRALGDRPLYQHVLQTLLKTPGVAQVIIDTDSPVISGQVSESFPRVTLVQRPEHLRDGHIAMNDVLAHTVEYATQDVVLQTHSTNPFVRSATFQEAIDSFHLGGSDSVFGVSRIQGRLWTHELRAVNHDPLVLERTQDLDPIYLENSCFYVFGRKAFQTTGNRIGKHPAVVEVPPLEAVDIDEESDFVLAEALWSLAQVRPT